jgi:hypothetical protein
MPTTDSTKAPGAQGRATLERASREYDLAHRTHLASEIIETIVRQSCVTDANVVAIRTSELTDALADVLVIVLAMVPDMDVSSRLRQAAENLSKRPRERFRPMALSWHNLPCALKAAIVSVSGYWATLASLPRAGGRGKARQRLLSREKADKICST